MHLMVSNKYVTFNININIYEQLRSQIKLELS